MVIYYDLSLLTSKNYELNDGIFYSRDVLIVYYNITIKDLKFNFNLFIIVKFQKKKL